MFICVGLLSVLAVNIASADNSERKKDRDSDVTYKEIKEIEIDPSTLDDAQKVCLDVVSSIDETAVDTADKKEPPKYWTNGILTQVGFSQVSLTNWAEGGSANISLNGLIDANANYAKDKMKFPYA